MGFTIQASTILKLMSKIFAQARRNIEGNPQRMQSSRLVTNTRICVKYSRQLHLNTDRYSIAERWVDLHTCSRQLTLSGVPFSKNYFSTTTLIEPHLGPPRSYRPLSECERNQCPRKPRAVCHCSVTTALRQLS